MWGLRNFRRKSTRYGLAFGDEFLLAARSRPGADKSTCEYSSLPYPEDLVAVSPVEPNFRAVSRLARLAGEALESVGCRKGPLAVVLPDLAIRTFVFPREGKLSTGEILTRVESRLAYPASEALMDTWQGRPSWVLAACIRRAVLHQYEQALEALGCHAAWVDGASLVRVPDWTKEAINDVSRGPAGYLRVHLQLYPRHYTLIVFRDGDLLDVRTKLRASADEAKVVADLERLPTVYESEDYWEITVRGEGAKKLVGRLREEWPDPSRFQEGEDGEEAHLARLAEILMRRL